MWLYQELINLTSYSEYDITKNLITLFYSECNFIKNVHQPYFGMNVKLLRTY